MIESAAMSQFVTARPASWRSGRPIALPEVEAGMSGHLAQVVATSLPMKWNE